MQGDKLPPVGYERALLRRQALVVKQGEAGNDGRRGPPLALWIVTSHCREWLKTGPELIRQVVPGCYRLEPACEEIYLIAANELPLLPALVPFLVARTGSSLL